MGEAHRSSADVVIVTDRNRGKGAAVRTGLSAGHGRTIAFTDADLAYGPEQVRRVLQAVEGGADVAIGTVYHHFPEYDDVIRACGAHTMVVSRPPTAAIFEGIRSPRERLRVLVRELFRFYDRIPEYERIHAERERFAFVSEAFQHIESARRTLIAAAVRPRRIGKRVGAAAFAMLEPAVHRALVASGLSTDHAAEVIFRALEHIIFRRTSR